MRIQKRKKTWVGIILTVLGILMSLFIPEVRQFVGLKDVREGESQNLVVDGIYGNNNTVGIISMSDGSSISNDGGSIIIGSVKNNNKFGKDKGVLCVYSTCNYGGKIKVFVNDKEVGQIGKFFLDSDEIYYNEPGSISLVLSTGNHRLKAFRDEIKKWEFDLIITEDECQYFNLSCN